MEGTRVGTWSRLVRLSCLGLRAPHRSLAHHCSPSSSSMGCIPPRISRNPLLELRNQLRKVATSICWNVSLIRPLVRCRNDGWGSG